MLESTTIFRGRTISPRKRKGIVMRDIGISDAYGRPYNRMADGSLRKAVNAANPLILNGEAF